MKSITLLSVLLFSLFTATAQTEATIEYQIEMSSSNPEMESQLAMFENSTMKLYMKDKMMRQETSMGGMINTTTIVDSDARKTLMLVDGMMGKFAAKMDLSEMDDEKETEDPDLDIEFVDETKEIVGYECKKAIVYDEDGNESVFWYTEEIEAPKEGSKYMKEGIPGMALEFNVSQPEMSMTFTATEFSKKVKKPKELFSMEVPEGYSEKTVEELQSLMGGGK
ncbi:MAG: hypothetical protein WED10_11540 [Brumimicrobium sp.]